MRFGLFLIAVFFLSSCAQIGELSGGPEDTTAPIPDSARMVPLNETKNFSGKEWVIPFNEFISLNNPTETIVVIPPNIKPKANVKGKKLILSWEDSLSPNTTYAFYLNGTVQDITEKNDSLMTFVFSTGDFIDSLTYSNYVVDAISGEPLPKFTIALYTRFADTIRPNYVGQTDRTGLAKLAYLKGNSYQIVAFEDKNRNLKPDIDERFGFLSDRQLIDQNIADSVAIRAYAPPKRKKINSVQFLGPKATCISAANLRESKVFIDGVRISPYHVFSSDSALFYLPQTDSSRFQIVVSNEWYSDTSRLSVTKGEKARKPQLKLSSSSSLIPTDSVFFYSNTPIQTIDLEKIFGKYIEAGDTTNANIPYLEVEKGLLYYTDYQRAYDELTLTFEPGAILFDTGMNEDTIRFTLINKKAASLGTIFLHTEAFVGSHVVEMMQDGKVISSHFFSENGELRLSHILPGEYSFRVLIDANNNGVWDGGNWMTNTQPEDYIYFQEKKKVRANWEMEIELNYAK